VQTHEAPVAVGSSVHFGESLIHEFTDRDDGHSTMFKTTLFLDYVDPGISLTAGMTILAIPLSALSLGGLPTYFASSYQLMSFRKLRIHYVTSAPTDRPGQILITYFDDSSSFQSVGSNTGISAIENAVATGDAISTSVWCSATLEPEVKPLTAQHLTMDTQEPGFTEQGLIAVQAVDGVTADVQGALWLELEMLCSEMKLSPQVAPIVTDTLTLTWSAYSPTAGAPILMSSLATPVTWSVTGPAGPISGTDPAYLWVGHVTAITGTLPTFYYPEEGGNETWSLGEPVFLLSYRLSSNPSTDSQQLTIYQSSKAATESGVITLGSGDAEPAQACYADSTLLNGSLTCKVRRVLSSNSGR
jgi:hypothetical protein